MVTSATARAAYDAWHRHPEIDLETRAPWHVMVKEYLTGSAITGADVLEIGCGRGEFSTWLAMHVAQVRRLVAADFSATAVFRARETLHSARVTTVSCAVADLQALPFASDSFDLVVSCETIEHVLDPAIALRELARVLRPGGRLVLTTPNYLGPLGAYRVYLRLRGRRYTETGQPINRFVIWPRTLAWIHRSGLVVEHTAGSGHYLPFPGRPPIRWHVFDRAGWLTRWFALHTLTVARRP